jgi:hypothetical protein
VPARKRGGEGDAGRPAARADVHKRPVEAGDEVEPGERVVEQDAPRLREIADRGETGRRDDRRQPPLQDVVQSAERRGRTTT